VVGVSALIAALFSPLHSYSMYGGSSHWYGSLGIGMGAQESVMRAALAEMIPTERRGVAYGFFNTVYGLAWFAGSFVMGIIYGFSPTLMVIVSVTLELLAPTHFCK